MQQHREIHHSEHEHPHERRHQHMNGCGACSMTLDELPVGSSAIIIAVRGEGALRDRLLDMGLTPKTRVMVRKVAPMGDPMELNLRGYELTLRRNDANNIDIVRNDEHDNRIGGESELRKNDAVQSTDGFQPACGQLPRRHRGAKGRRHPRP